MSFATILRFANTVLSAVATVTSVSIMAFAGYMIYENTSVQQRAYGTQTIQYKPEVTEDSVSVDALMANIPDAVGWITMDDTHIDYPVVQGPDDLYYASHDVYKNQSLTGAIYLQSKNKGDMSQSYDLLYGHHMDNGAMFGDLTNYLKPDYFNSHLSGKLTSLDKDYDVTVMSVIKTDAYEDAVYDITSLDWDGYNGTVLNNGNIEVVNTNPAVKNAVKFLVLSTCEGAATNGRVLLVCSLDESGKKVDPVVTPTPTPTSAPAPTKGGTPTATPTSAPEPTEGGTVTPTPAPTEGGDVTPVPTKADKATPTPAPTSADADVTPTPTPADGGTTPAPTRSDDKKDTPTPTPRGGAVTRTGDRDPYGTGWSLLNLCCLILTVLSLLPYLLNTRNSEEQKKKTIRDIAGPVTNVVLAIAAVLIFVIFENMRLPMIFNDKYTPWMMIILGIAVVTEEIASRRKKKNENSTGEESVNVQ